MTPAAVLLDCDGVIVDSEPIALALIAQDLTRHGLPITPAEAGARFLGTTIPAIAEAARALGARLPPDWTAAFYARFYARLAEGCPLVPGIEALLDRLDGAGIRYAVGSNGAPRKMEITLGHHPRLAARLAGRVFSGQALGCPKPDPGLWRHCAAHLGAPPAACVVVDDSPPGAIAAARAGIRCLGLARGGDGAPLAAQGAEVIESLAEVAPRLGLQG
jgi:HAD superfamily hydrolase (TIGR01509 family)